MSGGLLVNPPSSQKWPKKIANVSDGFKQKEKKLLTKQVLSRIFFSHLPKKNSIFFILIEDA